jgi:death on curing protein
MIHIEFVISLHGILIEKFGGSNGIRDYNALESAIARPFMTFDKQDLYPSPIEKAAALIESLISNHPFIDGNKRIGYVLMRYFLLEHKIDIKATQSDKFDFVMKIAKGQSSTNEICGWIKEKSNNIL